MNRQQRRAAERRAQRANSSAANDGPRLRRAVSLHQAGRLADAAAIYQELIAANPGDAGVLHLAGVAALQLGRPADAAALLSKAIRLNDRNAEYFCHHGDACAAQSLLWPAVDSYDRAIKLAPSYAEAHANRGNALAALGSFDAALASYQTATTSEPRHAEAWCNRGNVLRVLGRLDEAVASYDRALALQPGIAEAWSNRAVVLLELGQADAAIASFDRAVDLAPWLATAWSNRGTALAKSGQRQAALESYDRALAVRPDHAESWSHRGVVLFETHDIEAAVACLDRAVRLKPELAEAWYNRGNALGAKGDLAEAIDSYRKAVELKPDYAEAQSELIHARQLACEWRDRDADDQLLRDLVRDHRTVAPFVLLATTASPAEQLQCARQWSRRFARRAEPWPPRQPDADRRLRVGYLSGDFRQHPLAWLIVDLLEQHDRAHLHVIGYSVGRDDDSPIRHRVRSACDRFVACESWPDAAVAEAIARDQIDILVDLSGHTSGARTAILAQRPAPIQASWLGYIGSMGADFIDYIIADRVALPMDEQDCYDERIVHLPGCYQSNGRSRAIADRRFTRAECGLPERGFVFCCFNASYKITPAMFAVWMRLLAAVPDSVLWLVGSHPLAEANLRGEATRSGITPERLVFAPKVPYPDHLARHALADLFLDTVPYNAGVTASDALWTGLPLVTLRGRSFAGRMGASLLTAAGMPELIAESETDYAALAAHLARTPDRLAQLGSFLREGRATSALFDAAVSARHLEAAFDLMWQRHYTGQPPAGFALEERWTLA
jgi:predicted O-linked N-acetylglucosamine transferase (SPINDLY family)